VMRNNKAVDEEAFQAEFFKHGLCALVPYLVDLFNHVVRTCFPLSRSPHIIHPIQKSGPNSDPNNYKTIMVGHTFLKLYATVLYRNPFSEIESRHLRDKGRVGFRPTHKTIVHIFTLQAIIEEARHRSSKGYCCFVNFRKAFKSILREALFQRLIDINIYHTLFSAIMHLYESVLGILHN
jgi:hypothetical protein